MARKEHRRRILIVDDCLFVTSVLGRLPESRGYEVRGENDPTRALMAARRFRPDVMITDYYMPWKNGYELAADLAQDAELGGTPVIMITAYTPGDDERNLFAVLTKPFEV